MATLDQFQCSAWQQLKTNCSISCATQHEHQIEIFCCFFFQVFRTRIKTMIFLFHLFEESAIVHTLLSVNSLFRFSSGYLLHWKTRSVLMCRNKTIHHPVPEKWSTKQTKDPTVVVLFLQFFFFSFFYLPSE